MGVAFVAGRVLQHTTSHPLAKTGEIGRQTAHIDYSKRSEIGRYTGKRSEIGRVYRYSDGRVVSATSGWEDILVHATVGAWSGLRFGKKGCVLGGMGIPRDSSCVLHRAKVAVPHSIRNMVVTVPYLRPVRTVRRGIEATHS